MPAPVIHDSDAPVKPDPSHHDHDPPSARRATEYALCTPSGVHDTVCGTVRSAGPDTGAVIVGAPGPTVDDSANDKPHPDTRFPVVVAAVTVLEATGADDTTPQPSTR